MSKHLMQVDATYKDWLQSLGQRWQRSQIKAAVKVNSELLRFNWALGRDIAARRAILFGQQPAIHAPFL